MCQTILIKIGIRQCPQTASGDLRWEVTFRESYQIPHDDVNPCRCFGLNFSQLRSIASPRLKEPQHPATNSDFAIPPLSKRSQKCAEHPSTPSATSPVPSKATPSPAPPPALVPDTSGPQSSLNSKDINRDSAATNPQPKEHRPLAHLIHINRFVQLSASTTLLPYTPTRTTTSSRAHYPPVRLPTAPSRQT
jgi:hypothetical protein